MSTVSSRRPGGWLHHTAGWASKTCATGCERMGSSTCTHGGHCERVCVPTARRAHAQGLSTGRDCAHPAAIVVPGAGRTGGAHLALGDRLQSLFHCSIHRLAALPAGKFIFRFRLRGTLKVHPLYRPSEPPKCKMNLPNFSPSDCPVESASHLFILCQLLASLLFL